MRRGLPERFALSDRADEYAGRYLSGLEQRVALADPSVLLDKPTTGLDPPSARNLRELL